MVNPDWVSDGPLPRSAIREAVEPFPRMNPPIMTLFPPWTNPRVLMFANCESRAESLSNTSTTPTPVAVVLSGQDRGVGGWRQRRQDNRLAVVSRLEERPFDLAALRVLPVVVLHDQRAVRTV